MACFQYREDAERFYEHLKRRMGNFGLRLEEEKSRLIEFGKNAQKEAEESGKKTETFDFLGFTHYCSKSRSGKYRVKRKTSKKKMRKKCKEMNLLIKSMRNEGTDQIIKHLNEILTGYYHYYGITDNSKSINSFYYWMKKRLFYWLNRRSQKTSYTWEGYREMLKVNPMKRPRIYVSVYER